MDKPFVLYSPMLGMVRPPAAHRVARDGKVERLPNRLAKKVIRRLSVNFGNRINRRRSGENREMFFSIPVA